MVASSQMRRAPREISRRSGTTANAGLVYLGNDGQTGARLILDSSGTNYRATIHNGTTSQSVSLATATPTTGQMARLLLQDRKSVV